MLRFEMHLHRLPYFRNGVTVLNESPLGTGQKEVKTWKCQTEKWLNASCVWVSHRFCWNLLDISYHTEKKENIGKHKPVKPVKPVQPVKPVVSVYLPLKGHRVDLDQLTVPKWRQVAGPEPPACRYGTCTWNARQNHPLGPASTESNKQ